MEDDSEVWEDDSTVEDAVIEQHEDEEAIVQDLDAAGDLPLGDTAGDLPVGDTARDLLIGESPREDGSVPIDLEETRVVLKEKVRRLREVLSTEVGVPWVPTIVDQITDTGEEGDEAWCIREVEPPLGTTIVREQG
ncbi:unnamed protein product [Ilex paraguariensis]|uniref:Uncharacterized protein n=1 Tax=Ilex paraguariensis TaxID=185542 RepID=A0ABC8TWS3_9AQUA